MKKFDKSNRSSFKYWFAHWCAFQLIALDLHIWKFKYLFHDFEKPWFKLIMPYKKLQTWHRLHNSHHLEYGIKHGMLVVSNLQGVTVWKPTINGPEDCYNTIYSLLSK